MVFQLFFKTHFTLRTNCKVNQEAHLVVVDGSNAAERHGDGLLLPGDDDLVLGQAGGGDADASARLLAQLLHQPVVGSGDEGVEGLLQGETLHRTLVLVRGGGVNETMEYVNRDCQDHRGNKVKFQRSETCSL